MADDKKKVAGTIGAVALGAAVGAAAVALSDKKNREKLKGKFEEMKGKGEEKISELEQKAVELKEEGRKKLIAGLDKAKEKLEECDCDDDNCNC